jgi:hypothetical protein
MKDSGTPYDYVIGMINMLANSPESKIKVCVISNTIPVIDLTELNEQAQDQ